MLWANIVASYNPECLRDCENKGEHNECRCAAKMRIHAETSTFNLTLFDAHVNLLRTQTEAMSAALAGVDSMTVVPFDKTYAVPDEFSERLARNQQLLLKEESHFDKAFACCCQLILHSYWNFRKNGSFYQSVSFQYLYTT